MIQSSVCALSIAVAALLKLRGRRFVHLAQMHVVSSLPLLNAMFGPFDPLRTWEAKPLELLDNEQVDDRLEIGPIGRVVGDPAFGFRRTQASPDDVSFSGALGTPDPKEDAEHRGSYSIQMIDGKLQLDDVEPTTPVRGATHPKRLRLFSIGAVISIIIPLGTLLIYLGLNATSMAGGVLETNAQLSFVLVLTQVTSYTVSSMMPVVCAIHAYHVGAEWLLATQTKNIRNQPSPIQ